MDPDAPRYDSYSFLGFVTKTPTIETSKSSSKVDLSRDEITAHSKEPALQLKELAVTSQPSPGPTCEGRQPQHRTTPQVKKNYEAFLRYKEKVYEDSMLWRIAVNNEASETNLKNENGRHAAVSTTRATQKGLVDLEAQQPVSVKVIAPMKAKENLVVASKLDVQDPSKHVLQMHENDHVPTPPAYSPPRTNAITTRSTQEKPNRFSTELCSCMEVCCSGMWWISLCCQGVLWGQLMTRLKRSPWGDDGRNGKYRFTFGVVVALWAVYALSICCFLIFVSPHCSEEVTTNYYYTVTEYSCKMLVPSLAWTCWCLLMALSIYFTIVFTKTRYFFRQHYGIGTNQNCLEDCCCVYCCTCCSIIQMLRHPSDTTGTFQYHCCSTTGLPPDAPEII